MMLRRFFGHDAVYPADHDGDAVERVIDIDNLNARLQVRGDEIQVITGHFPLATAELLEGEYSSFTLLREPVNRTLSFLRHQRTFGSRWDDVDDADIYHHPPLFDGLIHNHMTKMLALRPDEIVEAGGLAAVEMTTAHLELAKENLSHLAVIGIQEDFPAFVESLNARYRWSLGEPVSANRTSGSAHVQSLREQIASDNELDIELYNYAKELLATRGPFGDPTFDAGGMA